MKCPCKISNIAHTSTMAFSSAITYISVSKRILYNINDIYLFRNQVNCNYSYPSIIYLN